jgi:hypothetical protein
VIVPCAPLTWESPCLELIFSTRVPVRIAAENCSVWERLVSIIEFAKTLNRHGALVVSATKSTREKEPTTSSNHPSTQQFYGVRLGGVDGCVSRPCAIRDIASMTRPTP